MKHTLKLETKMKITVKKITREGLKHVTSVYVEYPDIDVLDKDSRLKLMNHERHLFKENSLYRVYYEIYT